MPNLYLYNKIIPVAEKKRRQYTRYCSLKWKKCKAIRPKVIKKRARRSASIKSNCSRGGWKSQFRPTFPRWRKNLLLGNGDSRKKKKKKGGGGLAGNWIHCADGVAHAGCTDRCGTIGVAHSSSPRDHISSWPGHYERRPLSLYLSRQATSITSSSSSSFQPSTIAISSTILPISISDRLAPTSQECDTRAVTHLNYTFPSRTAK